MASEWADIREAREAAERETKERLAKLETAIEKRKRFAAMVAESECVAKNIAKVEKAMKVTQTGAQANEWMDVVMGNT